MLFTPCSLSIQRPVFSLSHRQVLRLPAAQARLPGLSHSVLHGNWWQTNKREPCLAAAQLAGQHVARQAQLFCCGPRPGAGGGEKDR